MRRYVPGRDSCCGLVCGGAVVARPAWEGREGREAGRAGQAGWRLSADPMVCQARSACRPGTKLAGVAYCPDVPDAIACDVEGEHRHDDAVLLSDQAGLAVDCALLERQAGHRAGDVDGVAGDLLGAFGRVEGGCSESAAVGDRRGAGIEQSLLSWSGTPLLLMIDTAACLPAWSSC